MFSLTLVRKMFNKMYILQVMHLGHVSDYRAMDYKKIITSIIARFIKKN